MKNIFKSTLYSIKKNKITAYVFVFCLMFNIALAVLPLISQDKNQVISGTLDNIIFFSILFHYVFICTCNCSDYKNKIINLEVMNGYSSNEIFWGRFFAFLVCGELLFHLGLIITHVLLGFNNEYFLILNNSGFGIVKLLLIELVYIAFFSFFIFCSFMGRNILSAIFLAWFGVLISLLADLLRIDRPLTFYMGLFSIRYLIMDKYHVGQMAVVAIISVVCVTVFLLLGNLVVRRQEF